MKTVIDMAREAGGYRSAKYPDEWRMDDDDLERFAELVRADEREACAKVCENEWSNLAESKYGEECADAIRARGQK